MMIKKMIFILLTLFMLAGCTEKQSRTAAADPDVKEAKPVVIRLGGLKGPTSMGMAKLIEDAQNGETKSKIEFTMAASADELAPKLLGKVPELDVLAVPANLASVLYNNSKGEVEFMAINTLGVIYIVEKGERSVRGMADLKGKTIYATGKGATPELTLDYLLIQNGVLPSEVNVEWKSEPAEIVAAMAKQDHAIAMMPQPFVTVAQTKAEGLTVVLDLTKEWDKLDNGSKCVTAGLIVRKEFAEKYPEQLRQFLAEYKASAEYLNANVEEGAELVDKLGIVKAPIAKKSIPACNVTYIDGSEMKTIMQGYLKILFLQNPKSVGGKLPGGDFYYVP